MNRAGLAILLMTLSACASSQGPNAHVSPSLSPAGVASVSPAPSALFAVVESSVAHGQPETVAIVGIDGRVVASASFQPRTQPQVPNAYVPLQGVAQVVGSGVYYIDGVGTVRVLRLGSQPQTVAHFLLPPTQMDTWFAVSPDGSGVMEGILALPGLGPLIPGTSWHSLVGSWKFSLMTATSGGAPTESLDVVSGDAPADLSVLGNGLLGYWWPTFPVAWTSAGPIAMYPVALSSQNIWQGGRLQTVILAPDGVHEDQLGGDDCFAASITPAGVIPCESAKGPVSVRDSMGKLLWATHVDGFRADWLHLSPNGEAITDGVKVETRTGGMVAMPRGFHVQGWLDNSTVVGRPAIDDAHEGNLAWISLGNPSTPHDLGLNADFVAPLT